MKYKKAVSLLLYVLIIFLALNFHVRKLASDDFSTNNKIRGNSESNIKNLGLAATDGDWIYYSTNSGLYKTKCDGSNKIKLCDDKASFINVYDDWVYYNSGTDISSNFISTTGYLYKIKKDGSNRTLLVRDTAQFINIVDGWIYYCSHDTLSTNSMYKIKFDGSSKTKLSDNFITGMYSEDNWIYYTSRFNIHSNINKSYRIKNDGTEKYELLNSNIEEMIAYNGWIYYLYNGNLYRIKVDGSKKSKILTDVSKFSYINITGDWIFYCKAITPKIIDVNYRAEGQLRKIKVDGGEDVNLTDGNISNINVVGEWIFYTINNFDGNHRFYKIKTDGSNQQVLD